MGVMIRWQLNLRGYWTNNRDNSDGCDSNRATVGAAEAAVIIDVSSCGCREEVGGIKRDDV